MAYENTPYSAEAQQLARRRQMLEAMAAQTIAPQQTQMVGNRVVPYSLGQGLAKVAQALITKKGLDSVKEEEKALNERRTQDQSDAMKQIIDTMTGKPQTGGPLQGGEYKRFEPEVKPDPVKAALMASTDPRLQGNKSNSNIIAALLQKGRGDYYSPHDVTLPDGTVVPYSFSHRDNKWFPPNIEGLKSPRHDPETIRKGSEAKKSGEKEGELRTVAEIDLPAVEHNAEYLASLVESMRDHPGMSDVIGLPNLLTAGGLVPGTEGANFRTLLSQVEGKAFLEAYQSLKGGGQITEIEGQKATAALARMQTAQSEKSFIAAANEFVAEIKKLTEIARKRAGKPTRTEEPKKEKVIEVDW